MGRHLNADAGPDDNAVHGSAPDHDSAQHLSDAGHPLAVTAVISPDTHVGVDLGTIPPGTPNASASPANPEALIEHGLVGDGHELEEHPKRGLTCLSSSG